MEKLLKQPRQADVSGEWKIYLDVRPGIIDTEVGYIGGQNDHPTYPNHPGMQKVIELTCTTQKKQILEKFLDYVSTAFINQQQWTNR